MKLKEEWQLIARSFSQEKQILGILAITVTALFLGHYVLDKGMVGKLLGEKLAIDQASFQLIYFTSWGFASAIVYGALPICFIRYLKQKPSDYGWHYHGLIKQIPIYLILYTAMFPILFLLSTLPDFHKIYPFFKYPKNAKELFLWELAYGLQFLMLEFLFRGFLLHGLNKLYGAVPAILISTLPYVMIHFPKHWTEAFASIFAGLILGWLSLRTRSIFGGALLHISVAWTMDLLILWRRGWFA